MESLYTKYRPQTFQDVVGQQVVVSTLENAVLEHRIGHAYLFCGPRGTGKTTMARLLAKALLCQQGEGQLPDGTCEDCKLIAAGEHPDVYELDAASRTGVDNVREEIINRVGYAPVRGKHKVYIIDEVHMLTTAAFNALLKTLEEPPEHVVFVLCTTDPQKIPATILSRVQRFDFHSIGNDDIRQRLAYVCQHEGFQYDDEALDLVVRHARGGMRDALSTLEQLSVFGNGKVSVEAAQDMLGSVPGSALAKVCQAMAARDVATLYQQVGSLVDSGRDLLQFVRELAAHVRDVYVVCAVGPRQGVVNADQDQLQRLDQEAQAFGSVDRVAHVLSVLGDASNQMRTAANQRLCLEIAFTRIARPESDLTLEALADRVATLEAEARRLRTEGVPAGQGSATSPVPAATAVQAATARPATPSAGQETHAAQAPVPGQAAASTQTAAPTPRTTAAPAPARASAQPTAVPGAPASSAARASSAPRAAAPTAPVRTAAANASAAPAPVAPSRTASAAAIEDPGQLQRLWKQAVDTLVRTIPSRGSLLMSSHVVSDDGSSLSVVLPQHSTFALKMLERADVRTAIEPVISQVFGGPRQLNVTEAALDGSRGGRSRSRSQATAAQHAAPARRPRAAAPAGTPAAAPAAAAPATAAPRTPAPRPAASAAGGAAGGMSFSQSNAGQAPAAQAPAAPAAQTPAYDMPWDPVPQQEAKGGAPASNAAAPGGARQGAPAQAASGPSAPARPANAAPAQSAPMEPAPYEEVPYDDADAVNYGDDAQMYADAAPVQAPPAASGAFGGQAAPGKPSGASHGNAASTSQGSGQRTFGQPAQVVPASSVGAPASAGDKGATVPGVVEPGTKVETFDAKSVPDDIPDDLRAIIEDAFEVFGDGVQISSVTPATSDEEASAELAAQQEEDDQANPEDDATGEGFVDDAEAGADEDDD